MLDGIAYSVKYKTKMLTVRSKFKFQIVHYLSWMIRNKEAFDDFIIPQFVISFPYDFT